MKRRPSLTRPAVYSIWTCRSQCGTNLLLFWCEWLRSPTSPPSSLSGQIFCCLLMSMARTFLKRTKGVDLRIECPHPSKSAKYRSSSEVLFGKKLLNHSFSFIIRTFTDVHPATSPLPVQQKNGWPAFNSIGVPCLVVVISDYRVANPQ